MVLDVATWIAAFCLAAIGASFPAKSHPERSFGPVRYSERRFYWIVAGVVIVASFVGDEVRTQAVAWQESRQQAEAEANREQREEEARLRAEQQALEEARQQAAAEADRQQREEEARLEAERQAAAQERAEAHAALVATGQELVSDWQSERSMWAVAAVENYLSDNAATIEGMTTADSERLKAEIAGYRLLRDRASALRANGTSSNGTARCYGDLAAEAMLVGRVAELVGCEIVSTEADADILVSMVRSTEDTSSGAVNRTVHRATAELTLAIRWAFDGTQIARHQAQGRGVSVSSVARAADLALDEAREVLLDQLSERPPTMSAAQ